MNKKQVAALLKVIGKDDMRKALTVAYIDKYEDNYVLVATDGTKLAAVYLDEYAEELVGAKLKREYIERWYKLATGKSRLNSDELKQLLTEQEAAGDSVTTDYPNWQSAVPKVEPEGQKQMKFNAEFFKIVQELDGADDIVVTLYGEVAPMQIKTERGFYIVMPMKNK